MSKLTNSGGYVNYNIDNTCLNYPKIKETFGQLEAFKIVKYRYTAKGVKWLKY